MRYHLSRKKILEALYQRKMLKTDFDLFLFMGNAKDPLWEMLTGAPLFMDAPIDLTYPFCLSKITCFHCKISFLCILMCYCRQYHVYFLICFFI